MAHRISHVTTKLNSLGAWDARVTVTPKDGPGFSFAVPCSFMDRRDARDYALRQSRDFLTQNLPSGTVILTARNSHYI